jgi:spore maturation protein CgeB
VLSVNLRGLIHPEAMSLLLRRLGIPLALWFVDSPEFILEEAALPPRDVCRVFLWDRAYEPGVRALGYPASWLPLAADEALLPAARPDPRFEGPLSFVGNTLLTGFLERLAVQLPRTEAVTRLREQAIAAVMDGRGRQLEVLEALVARHAHLLPPGRAQLHFRAAVLHGATSAYRIDLLGRLLPLGVRFFGDPEGWRRALGPGARVHPDVSYAREVPSVYASSGISFSATSLQMPRAVNQRCFDVPLFGGFLLTDRQGDLADLFAEDEVATYEGPGDVAERAREYLAAPALRREIATRARVRVLGEHTYRRRMQQLLEGVFGEPRRRAS